ncbi:hypothetical protein GQ53DRAFT_823841 [Thozetella sp. PMI_491]|nr:hypothetical protein GQ53DRAFT_823841 [Thozetella sp. PMI_491]
MDTPNPSDVQSLAATPRVRYAVCDRCGDDITGTRHRCQACPDFDYCSKCAVQAPVIHPGHEFLVIDPTSETAPKEGDSQGGQEPPESSDTTASDPAETTASDLADTTSSQPAKYRPCRSCTPVISVLSAIEFLTRSHLDEGGILPGEISAHWPIRISSLVEATQTGCAFCAFVLTKFFGPGNGVALMYKGGDSSPWYADPAKHDERRKTVVDHCMNTLTRLQHDRFTFAARASCERKGGLLPDFDTLVIAVESMHCRTQEEMRGVFNSAGVLELKSAVYAAHGDPAATKLSSRTPNASPESDAGFRQAKAWLEECVTSHGSECGSAIEAALPAYVIDVSGSELRLHKAAPGERGHYVALTYHRGGERRSRTTSANLDERLSGFSVECLPKAFKDAVTTTQNLGLRYLWIDAVCVPQGSDADMAAKAPQLAGVYNDAYVTISAASCDSADSSFLESAADPVTGLWKNMVPMKFPIPHQDAKTVEDTINMPKQSIGIVWLLDEDPALAPTFADPIASDPWSLQERLLSRRLLSYGRWPTWRCNKSTLSDGGFFLEPKSGPSERRLLRTLAREPTGSADLFTTVQIHKRWYEVLNQYSKSELAVASDRLPAIGGIAAEISRVTGATYQAGLWSNNMLRDLMWYADTREWLSRPQEWRAPTWSWASVNAPILCNGIEDDAEPLGVIHFCEVSPALGHTAFGEIAGGVLEISGPMAEVHRQDVLDLFDSQDMAPPPPKSNRVSDWYAQMLEGIANRPRNRVTAEEAAAALPERVYALLTFTADWRIKDEDREDETCYSGLLLREVEDGRYERIGAFTNEITEWLNFDQQPWVTQRIILV